MIQVMIHILLNVLLKMFSESLCHHVFLLGYSVFFMSVCHCKMDLHVLQRYTSVILSSLFIVHLEMFFVYYYLGNCVISKPGV